MRCNAGCSGGCWPPWLTGKCSIWMNAGWNIGCTRNTRGERLYAQVAGSRRHRTSIIAASQNAKLVAPFVFEGSCNTEVVDTYFEKMLLPALPQGSVIVLDNASFHQSPSTQKLVADAGCELLFLPTYSPDLNPIEHVWVNLKAALRRVLPKAKHPARAISNMCKCYTS